MLGEIAQQAAHIDIAQHRRRFAHGDGAGAEGFDRKAELAQVVGPRDEPRGVRLVEFDDFRDQQDLPRHAGFLDRGLHALVDDALMRGVLVDDDEAVAGLRHDIGFVDLRARRAQWTFDLLGGGLEALDTSVGRRFADIESFLRCFGKTKSGVAARRRHRHRPRRRIAPIKSGAPRYRDRTERRDSRAAAGRGRALTFARQRFLQRTHDQPAHQSAVAETHLGLGRMHVDVDLAALESHEQRQQRMAVARQIVGIGRAHRADQNLVTHRPAVNEQILAERVGARQRRQSGEAFQPHAFALRIDGDGIGAEVGAQHIAEPRQFVGGGAPGDRRTLLTGEREGDVRPAHRQSPHDLAHGFGFAAVGLQELQPRRRGVKQIAHLDRGAVAERGGLGLALLAGIDFQRPGVRLVLVPRRDDQPRHRADRRQGFAAKTERVDRQKIVAGQFRGGVAVDRQLEIGARHAVAIVGDADQAAAAAIGQHVDAMRAGIERVLDQFLDHARRPLDHLAGGDAVDHGLG